MASKMAIGLDIGSTSIKMILLKEQRRRGKVAYALQSFGMKPLPPEAIAVQGPGNQFFPSPARSTDQNGCIRAGYFLNDLHYFLYPR